MHLRSHGRPRLDIEREQTLQRFFALPRNDQLEVYRVVRDFLAAGAPLERTEKDKVLDDERGALEAMARVAHELGLPERQAPTSTQSSRWRHASRRSGRWTA